MKLQKYVWLLLLLAGSVFSQGLKYYNYGPGYYNLYSQKESNASDRFFREAYIADTVIDGYVYKEIRTCVLRLATDSCIPERMDYFYYRESLVANNGVSILTGYQIAQNKIDTHPVFDRDTILSSDGDTVRLRKESSCLVNSVSYSDCFHVFSVNDSESFHAYFVAGIGLVRKEQIIARADLSYHYIYQYVNETNSSVLQQNRQTNTLDSRRYFANGKMIMTKPTTALSTRNSGFNGQNAIEFHH